MAGQKDEYIEYQNNNDVCSTCGMKREQHHTFVCSVKVEKEE